LRHRNFDIQNYIKRFTLPIRRLQLIRTERSLVNILKEMRNTVLAIAALCLTGLTVWFAIQKLD
jgi:hypothetical protein